MLDLQFLNDLGHLAIEGHLAVLELRALAIVDAQACVVAAPDAGDLHARTHLLLEAPLDLKHAPVLLDRDCRLALRIPVLLRLAARKDQSLSRFALRPKPGPPAATPARQVLHTGVAPTASRARVRAGRVGGNAAAQAAMAS